MSSKLSETPGNSQKLRNLQELQETPRNSQKSPETRRNLKKPAETDNHSANGYIERETPVILSGGLRKKKKKRNVFFLKNPMFDLEKNLILITQKMIRTEMIFS